MRITDIATDRESSETGDLEQALRDYEARDQAKTDIWLGYFSKKTSIQS